MTPKEKSTLITAGLAAGAVVWAGPQILAMLFVLLFLGLFAGVVLLAMAATLLKYGLLVGCAVGAVYVAAKLIGGPKRKKPSFTHVDRKKRLAEAALDLELLKAMKNADAQKR
jgi:hypothetical protein